MNTQGHGNEGAISDARHILHLSKVRERGLTMRMADGAPAFTCGACGAQTREPKQRRRGLMGPAVYEFCDRHGLDPDDYASLEKYMNQPHLVEKREKGEIGELVPEALSSRLHDSIENLELGLRDLSAAQIATRLAKVERAISVVEELQELLPKDRS